jgi:hypothetical protein
VVASGVGGAFEHRGATAELRVPEGHQFHGRWRHSTVRPSADAAATQCSGAFSQRTAAR